MGGTILRGRVPATGLCHDPRAASMLPLLRRGGGRGSEAGYRLSRQPDSRGGWSWRMLLLLLLQLLRQVVFETRVSVH